MSIEDQDPNELLLFRNESEGGELFSLQEFIISVNKLAQTSILFYCPHSRDRLAQFYYVICDQMRLPQMNLKMMRGFVQAMRNQNRKYIKGQLRYYLEQISQKRNEGIKKMSNREFNRLLDKASLKFMNDKVDYQIITDMLREKAKKPKFINCDKILELLKDISNEVEEYIQPSLSPEKILDKRFSERSEQPQLQLKIDELAVALINDPKIRLQSYFDIWHKKISLFSQFITDIQIREQAEGLGQSLKGQLIDLLQGIRQLQTQNQQLQNRCLQHQETIKRKDQQKQLYDEVIIQFKNHIYDLKAKLVEANKEKRQVQQHIQLMERQIEQGSEELKKLHQYHKEIEEEIKEERSKYTELYQQYEKVTTQFNVKSQIVKKEQIFEERSLKQKLDDTLRRFNRVLKQRQQQKKIQEEKQQQYTTKIQILQAKIESLETQIKNKKQDLRDFVPASKINFRGSFNRSFISDKNDSMIFRGSVLMNSRIAKSKIKNRETLTFQNNSKIKISQLMGEDLSNKPTNKQKLELMYIGDQDLSKIPEENTNISESQLTSEQSTKPLKEIKAESSSQIENKELEDNEQNVVRNELNDAQHFLSKGVFISVHGLKQAVTILLNRKRFCYFDSKARLVRYLPLENIDSFIFCRENCTLFILKPKNTQQLDEKKHIVNPMIFSIRSREKLASYLTTKMIDLVRQMNIELITKLQDNIFLKTEEKEVSLKHKTYNLNNPYRLALSDQPVFYVQFQEAGTSTINGNGIIVIQPMGLICFNGKETDQLDKNQQFICYLPLHDCNLSQIQNSTEAPDKKLSLHYQKDIQRYFNLVFSSSEDLQLFVKECEKQKVNSKNNKDKLFQRLEVQLGK